MKSLEELSYPSHVPASTVTRYDTVSCFFGASFNSQSDYLLYLADN